jgi:hypothetical protein
MTMMVGNNERRECAADDDGTNKEGNSGKGDGDAMRVAGNKEGKGNGKKDGIGDEGGV